jgi:hypothetical protein
LPTLSTTCSKFAIVSFTSLKLKPKWRGRSLPRSWIS